VVESDARAEPGGAATDRGVLRVNATCVIRLDELEWRTTGSGGPGGQHANTSDTRVEVRFSIEASASLAPRQKERLLERLGPVARATASDSRSQARNRELALERLRSRLELALRVDPPRRSTKPSKSAKEARLDDKRRQSERKQARRRPNRDD
jgi:ribosome-associated protein